MTLETLLSALYAWREARQKRIDGFLRAENPLRTLQREQESLNVLAAAVDEFRAEHDARREPDGKETP